MMLRQTCLVAGPAGSLAVDVRGNLAGSAIVLLHPINTAAQVWEPVAELLGHPVVVFDLRGHGRSTMAGPFAIEGGWLDDLMAVLDALELASAHLVGGSLGGTISLAAAALHPARVRSVTTFGSTLGVGVPTAAIEAMVRKLTAKGTVAYFEELVPQVVGADYRTHPRVLTAMRAAVGTRDPAIVAGILRGAFTADIHHLAGRVTVPVLAAAGTSDPTCPGEMTAEIAAVTGGTAMALPGVGHLPMLEAPEQVAALIARHIDLTV
jgi:pimeloyl-ACP methyl ester carboxylesterase